MIILKLLGVINDDHYQKYLESGLSGFLFALKGFSCDYDRVYTLEEIRKIKLTYPTSQCFIVMNKMMYQKDLNGLLNALEEIEKMKVDGILFYDNSIPYLVKQKKLSIPLYLHQTHFVTNSQMINEYASLGVSGAYLSNEITKQEIVTIASKTDLNLMMMLVGYPVVAMSKRKLVHNYFKNNGKDYQEEIKVIEPSSKQNYIVKETNEGTSFLYGKRLNASICYLELENIIEYGIVKQDDLCYDSYQKLISAFRAADLKAIDQIVGHNRGFLFRKTIYQVKKK